MEEDARTQHLLSAIRLSIDQMMSPAMAEQLKKKKLSNAALASKLGQVLQIALKCDREQYLETLQAHMQEVENENVQLKKQLLQQKQKYQMKMTQIDDENTNLRRRIRELEDKVQATGWKHEQSGITSQSKIEQRDRVIRIYHKALIKSKTTIHDMSNEISNLKAAFAKLMRMNSRMVNTIQSHLSDLIIASQRQLTTKVQRHTMKRVMPLVEKEKNDKEQMENATEALLKSIWSMSPQGKPHPRIAPLELPVRILEVQSFINSSIADQQKSAVEQMRHELSITLPEVSFTEDPVPEAVTKAVRERVDEREEIYKKQLAESAKREAKIKKKLEKALQQIQRLQERRSPTRITIPDIAEDAEIAQDEWESQKQELDMKMSRLSQSIGRYSISSFE